MDKLAHRHPCQWCGADVYVVICTDGRWRCFDAAVRPPAEYGVWAWRKRHGMEEQSLVGGHGAHYCPKYDGRAVASRELFEHFPWLNPTVPEPAPEPTPAPAAAPIIPVVAHETFLPSPEIVERARSTGGGWTLSTLAAWGVPWPPPKGWRADLERRWRDAQHD